MGNTRDKLNIFWFRRDLRLEDNHALSLALKASLPVFPIFVFDTAITDSLARDDSRITFIHSQLKRLKHEIQKLGGDLFVANGTPLQILSALIERYEVNGVFTNEDYEPYAIKRDAEIAQYLKSQGVNFLRVKDQVIFAKDEVLKADGKPYTVFTPYKKKYLQHLRSEHFNAHSADGLWYNHLTSFPALDELGFEKGDYEVLSPDFSTIAHYNKHRDFPAKAGTSKLGPHLRFGTLSVRELFRSFLQSNETFISELIWREFFMQILYHYPQVVTQSFRPKYDRIKWRNNEEDFALWCVGKTGYPLVDAGMRELNATGYMHNRVRMVTASFLCKHLLIDWRWGEAYFAEKLLDFELASNNGNWQWAAGTGCDAAPYFRVFNPLSQQQKFDQNMEYISKWVPEWKEVEYPKPLVDHKRARERTLAVYKEALSKEL